MDSVQGIYRIVCVKSGRYYFGSSINIKRRWRNHKRLLARNEHPNPIMQNAWNKHGEESFRCEMIEILPELSPQELLDAEEKYLVEHVGKRNCFNIAQSAKAPSAKGHTQSKESNDKRSQAAREQWKSKRDQMVASMKNCPRQKRTISDEERERRKQAITNAWTPERREQMRLLAIGRNKDKGHF